MNTDSESLNVLGAGRVLHSSAVEDTQRAEAALKNHSGAFKYCHHTVAAKLVNVSAVLMNEADLIGKKRADERKQLLGLGFLGESGESAHVGEANCEILFLRGRSVSAATAFSTASNVRFDRY